MADEINLVRRETPKINGSSTGALTSQLHLYVEILTEIIQLSS